MEFVSAAGVSSTSAPQISETSSDAKPFTPIPQAFTLRATPSSNDATLSALVERLDQIEEKLYALQLSEIGGGSEEKTSSSNLAELTEGYYKAQQEVMNTFQSSFQSVSIPAS